MPDVADVRSSRLASLCSDLVSKRRVLVLAARAPVAFERRADGSVVERREGGPLAAAFEPLRGLLPLTWVAMGDGLAADDRGAAERESGLVAGLRFNPHPNPPLRDESLSPSGQGEGTTDVRWVQVPRRVQHRHFNVICNPLLWSLHHGVWNPAYAPVVDDDVADAWERGYVEVNRAYADATVAALRAGRDALLDDGLHPAAVLVRDYQLYLVPGLLRGYVPDALLHFHLDIPWPDASWWRLLPLDWRRQIFESLLSCDVVGFSSAADMRRFALVVTELAPEAAQAAGITGDGQAARHVRLRVNPPPLDAGQLKQIAQSRRVRDAARQLAAPGVEHTIVRVERAEPQKNIVRTVRAFSLLLKRRPELAGKVRLLLVLAPPAPQFSQFRRYADEVRQAVDEVNAARGAAGWRPVELHLENNYPKALAALALYDTLVVTPVADASATAAREGAVVNGRDGVVAMTDAAGPWERVREHVLTVSAGDIAGLADAMAASISMPTETRAAMAAGLRAAVLRESPVATAEALVGDLLEAGK